MSGIDSSAVHAANIGRAEASNRPAHGELPGYVFVVPWRLTDDGGVNRVVRGLYRQFESAGACTPRVLVTSWHHVRPITLYEDGHRVTYMRVRGPVLDRTLVVGLGKWLLFLVRDLLRIGRYLRFNRVGCVNLHYPSLVALQFVLARALFAPATKIILSFHGLDLANAMRTKGLERRTWRMLMQAADAIVCCSNSLANTLTAFEPSVRQRTRTIHNGIDVGESMAVRNLAVRVDPRLERRRFILSVASYEHKKGLDTLLHAFGLLRHRHAGDVMLALVGADRGMGETLRELAVRIGVSDQVVFCGKLPHAHLHAYYGAAALFCLSSRTEPFGVVLLEAAVFRCPVVATSVGGIPEILEHGTSARLVPPEDPDALALRLAQLLDDRERSNQLADALYRRVSGHFTSAKAHRSYVRLLRELEVGKDRMRRYA